MKLKSAQVEINVRLLCMNCMASLFLGVYIVCRGVDRICCKALWGELSLLCDEMCEGHMTETGDEHNIE